MHSPPNAAVVRPTFLPSPDDGRTLYLRGLLPLRNGQSERRDFAQGHWNLAIAALLSGDCGAGSPNTNGAGDTHGIRRISRRFLGGRWPANRWTSPD